MSVDVHMGDIGTVFEATILDENGAVVDISTATTLQIVFRAPDGTVTTKTATLSSTGTDGKMRYVTTSGDVVINAAGQWRAQAVATWSNGKWHASTLVFTVAANL